MRNSRKVIYYGNGFDITLRELLFSIVIILAMITVGFFLSEKIASKSDEANQEYYQAIKIDGDTELFKYGMRTDVGNAFVYGTLEAVDPVSYSELDSSYAYIEKVKERYTRHTRQVAHTITANGKTQTYYTTETYWTWDRVGSEEIHCTKISFCGVEFDYGMIDFPSTYCADTIKESSSIRYKYYVCDTSYDGTVYGRLADNSITGAIFVDGENAEEAMKTMCSYGMVAQVIFWIFWVFLIGLAVYGFCYFDNQWLEDN
jgi:hypothetical protein